MFIKSLHIFKAFIDISLFLPTLYRLFWLLFLLMIWVYDRSISLKYIWLQVKHVQHINFSLRVPENFFTMHLYHSRPHNACTGADIVILSYLWLKFLEYECEIERTNKLNGIGRYNRVLKKNEIVSSVYSTLASANWIFKRGYKYKL